MNEWKDNEAELSARLFGELPPDEDALVDSSLADNSERSDTYEDIKDVVDSLQNSLPPLPDAPRRRWQSVRPPRSW